MKHTVMFLLSILAIFSIMYNVLAYILDTPDVYISYSTKQCTKVVIYDGPNEKAGSCKNLPARYNVVWIK